jgi:hypothetical protein
MYVTSSGCPRSGSGTLAIISPLYH